MGTESDVRLAIRTIAVTSRAAIDSNTKVGRPDLAAASAVQGLAMLRGLRDQLGPELPVEIRTLIEAATRDLTSAARTLAGDDASVIPEEVRAGGQP